MPTSSTADIIKVVTAVIQTREALVWIGAGASADLHPDWDWEPSVKQLCVRIGVSVPPGKLKTTDYLLLAEQCKSRDKKAYVAHIMDTYGRPSNKKRTLYDNLVNLPFAAYVTTNFDPLLLNTYRQARFDRHRCFPDFGSRSDYSIENPAAFYLHGCAQDFGTANEPRFVFCDSEYKLAYDRPGYVLVLIGHELCNKHMVFIGSRLDEDYVRKAFKLLKDRDDDLSSNFDGRKPPERVILCPDDVEPRLTDEYTEMGFRVLTYSSADHHAELESIVQELSDTIGRQRPVPFNCSLPVDTGL